MAEDHVVYLDQLHDNAYAHLGLLHAVFDYTTIVIVIVIKL